MSTTTTTTPQRFAAASTSIDAVTAVAPAALDDKIDRFEAGLLASFPACEPQVFHRFTPGLYIREFHAPAGSVFTSKIHRTEHPYVISMGLVTVYSETDGVQRIRGPYTGITKPGTRRVIFFHEDTVWTTFHPTPHTDIARIEADIIEPHHNPHLPAPGPAAPALPQ